MVFMFELNELSEFVWEVPKSRGMSVPVKLFVDGEMVSVLKQELETNWSSLKQLKNVASLPGLLGVVALPDVHPGYGSPIGAVVASDLNEGVINFASNGFDLNCLSGESFILDEFGVKKKIKCFEKNWVNESIKCVDSKKIKNTLINAFMKFETNKKVFEVITESGKKIIATEDHPFKTRKGMVELKKLKNEFISVYPFEGVEFEKVKEKTLMTEKELATICPNKTSFLQTKNFLKKNKLLPLKNTSKKFPYLVRLFGYALGDGHFHFNKKADKGIGVSFYGKKTDLKKIEKDLNSLGFNTYSYSRERKHNIKTKYSLVEFESIEHSVKVSGRSISSIMFFLGLPSGDKTVKEFLLPAWLMKSPKWIKRLFLAGFFGAELTTPNTIINHGFTLNQPVISMNKIRGKEKNAKKFLEQIIKLLKEFKIDSNLIKEREEYTKKNGKKSIRLRLVISGKSKNLIRLYGKIGFEYNSERSFYANIVKSYLELKEKTIKERNQAEKKAVKLKKEKNISAKKIYEKLKKEFKWINLRFVERSIYEKRKTSARIAFNFPKFKEFLKTRTKNLGKTGEIWEKIVSKKEIKFNKPVYDFNVKNKSHNFIANNFVVSNCGVRAIRTGLTVDEVNKEKKVLSEKLFKEIPAGLGVKGKLELKVSEMNEVIKKGAKHIVKLGYGNKKDLEFTEEKGCVKNANPEFVSMKAKQRQFKQIGTLGSGNHYLEVQEVKTVFNKETAKAFGLKEKEIIVSIHCGSRALGHQIGMDYLEILDKAVKKYKLKIPDKELVSAPIQSEEGQQYFSAINAGINTAFANRQMLTHLTRQVFSKVFNIDEEQVQTLYDVGHNTAKIEKHLIEGKTKKILVQRKGSTRGFGPNRKEIPTKYRKVGQPVLIGGSMGTSSFILSGTKKAMRETFGTTIHGAGRKKSRHQAKKEFKEKTIKKYLKEKKIIVKAHSVKGLLEEAPQAYKDIQQVINIVHKTKISEKIVELKPLICIKG